MRFLWIKKKKPLKNQGFAMRLVGLEPTRCHQRQILSLMRLPVPPQAHNYCLTILS